MNWVWRWKCSLSKSHEWFFILIWAASRDLTLKDREMAEPLKWRETIKLVAVCVCLYVCVLVCARVCVCLFVLMSICQYRPDNHGNTQGDFLPVFTAALRLYSEVNIWAGGTTLTPCNTFITAVIKCCSRAALVALWHCLIISSRNHTQGLVKYVLKEMFICWVNFIC